MSGDRDPSTNSGRERRRVRLGVWSTVRAVLIVAAALAAVAFVAAASRPLGWLAAAIMVAALLEPPVRVLSGFIPRGLAAPLVLLAGLTMVGGLAFGVVGDVSDQVTRLERAAPRAARDIERSDRFGEFASEVDLGRRVDVFVGELPNRLRGGDEVTAIRSAATRGVAFVAAIVLTVFLMLSGPSLLSSGFEQITDTGRRERLRSLLARAHVRWWRYLVLTLGRMIAAGLFGYAVARVVDVPGPVLLALWVGVWSIVPTVGVVVGSSAVALLAVPDSFGTAGAVLAFFFAYQVIEDVLVQPRLERVSLHVGAFLTFVAAVLGLEVYGIGGLVGAVVIVVFAAAILKEIGLDEDEGFMDAAHDVVGDGGGSYGDGPTPVPAAGDQKADADVKIYTRRGDDGTTGLLFGDRVRKDAPAPAAYGTVDEAQAALGVARAETERGSDLDETLIVLERDLWVLMAELAAAPSARVRLEPGVNLVTAAMVTGLEERIDAVSAEFDLPAEFVVPGQDRIGALLDVARTVIRRAERDALAAAPDDSHVVPYLNRLSDLVWTLARRQEGDSLATRPDAWTASSPVRSNPSEPPWP